MAVISWDWAATGVGVDRVQGQPTVAPVVRASGNLASRATDPTRRSCRVCTHRANPASSCSGPRRAKTRPKVSWEGMPCGRHSHRSNPARRFRPNSSTSTPGVGTADDSGQAQEENGRKRVSAGMGSTAGIRHALQTAPQGRGQARGRDRDSTVSTRSLDPGQALSQRNLAIALVKP